MSELEPMALHHTAVLLFLLPLSFTFKSVHPSFNSGIKSKFRMIEAQITDKPRLICQLQIAPPLQTGEHFKQHMQEEIWSLFSLLPEPDEFSPNQETTDPPWGTNLLS